MRLSNTLFILSLVFGGWLTTGCSVLETTGKTVYHVGKFAGKAAYKTAEVTGKVTWETAKLTGKGVKTAVHIAGGTTVVPLEREGNSMYVDVLLNRRERARFLLDTGASSTQISAAVARKIGIGDRDGEPVMVRVAGGHALTARAVNIKEIRVGRARIRNVRAIVFDSEQTGLDEGLLGMSFLNHFIFRIDAKEGELMLKKRME